MASGGIILLLQYHVMEGNKFGSQTGLFTQFTRSPTNTENRYMYMYSYFIIRFEHCSGSQLRQHAFSVTCGRSFPSYRCTMKACTGAGGRIQQKTSGKRTQHVYCLLALRKRKREKKRELCCAVTVAGTLGSRPQAIMVLAGRNQDSDIFEKLTAVNTL
eukprot:scpid101771/ scgid17697/ 